MFAGIYYGGMYGGSTTAILLNTPGESASVMTAVEGHLMARAGRGGAALATAAIGSFVAGTLATAALTFSAPVMANAALRFGPAEYFALTILAFVAVSSVLGESALNGLASLFFGLVLGLVGIDPLTGEARLSFGIPQLLDGIDVVIVAVGLFAVGESLFAASRIRHRRRRPDPAARIDLDDPRGLVPLLAAVAARHRAGVSGRRAAGRRIGDSDVSLVRARAPSGARPASVSATERLKASPDRRRRTTPRPPERSCRS